MEPKKVSVIIPTYKRSDFLERAIDSVINQTYKNVEIIVVDDNDPDSSVRKNTEEKVQKYLNKYENIMYLKNKKNLGGALARNEGIYHSTGYYITFLDDDDIYLPEKIEKQVAYMNEHDLDLSFTDVRIHNEKNKLIDYREHKYIKSFENEELLKYHLMHHLTPTGTYMFKRESLLNIGCFDNVKVGQEFRLMLKAIQRGLSIGYIPKSLLIQYVHTAERISVGGNKIQGEKELYAYKRNFFSLLNLGQKQYIRFRHHAVMAIVGIRSKNIPVFLKHFLIGMITSPLNSVFELYKYIIRIFRYK
ncbi:MAG: glycosyltransferase family 2 protein [Bacillaceae bacterium]|nr:glycosyltransferase family 2 protein [Bacillaceae bacterium]